MKRRADLFPETTGSRGGIRLPGFAFLPVFDIYFDFYSFPAFLRILSTASFVFSDAWSSGLLTQPPV